MSCSERYNRPIWNGVVVGIGYYSSKSRCIAYNIQAPDIGAARSDIDLSDLTRYEFDRFRVADIRRRGRHVVWLTRDDDFGINCCRTGLAGGAGGVSTVKICRSNATGRFRLRGYCAVPAAIAVRCNAEVYDSSIGNRISTNVFNCCSDCNVRVSIA